MDFNSIFEGIGTTIIEIILGLFGIGAGGYVISKFFSVKIIRQNQVAGNNVHQVQIGEMKHGTQQTDTNSRR